MGQNPFVKGDKPLVSKVVFTKDLKGSIDVAVSLIGGIEKVVEKGDTILLKPNYNTADPYPGSSDPNFIKAVIELLYGSWGSKSYCWRKVCLS